jgi:hypothetical protein
MRRTLLFKLSIPVLAAGSLALLGALTAASLAAADGLPGITTSISTPSVSLPSVTTPTLPVTVTVPSLSGATTTTPDSAPSTGTTVTTVTSPSDPPASGGGPAATAIGLPSGTVSVSASSLRTSSRLLIDRLHFTPTTIRARRQSLSLTLRVRDGAGHLVRGASVSVHSMPTTASRAVKSTTSIFGTASLRVATTTHLSTKPGSKLLLLLRVTAGRGNTIQVARLLAIPVRLH